MVRAVNTGIPAFIDSNGRIREPEHLEIMDESTAGVNAVFKSVETMKDKESGHWRRQCSAVLWRQIPLDNRNSIYQEYGDWFPIMCSLILFGFVCLSVVKPDSTNKQFFPGDKLMDFRPLNWKWQRWLLQAVCTLQVVLMWKKWQQTQPVSLNRNLLWNQNLG